MLIVGETNKNITAMPTSPRVQINPDVLRWAREWFNMDLQYVAKKMNSGSITEDTIKSWESGEKQPTYTQLKKISKILEKPLEIFLYPTVPSLPMPAISYRSVYGESYIKRLPPEMLIVISHAKNFQENLRELTHGQNPSEIRLSEYQFPEQLSEMTSTVRKLLKIELVQQKKNAGKLREAFEMWRNAFVRLGIYICKKPFKDTLYSGFCLHDKDFPIICVNSVMSYSRQIFTLFHELYHLIYKQNGIDIISNDEYQSEFPDKIQELEKKCDGFAAEFLVPTDDFKLELAGLDRTPNLNTFLLGKEYQKVMEKYIDPLSKKYCVSRDVILRKLSDVKKNTNLRKWYYENGYFNSDVLRNSCKKGGGSYYRNQVSYLGRPYINLVMDSQEKYGLPDYVVAEYLYTSVKNLPSLLKAAMRGRAQ
ncbi:MAG TPA: XRE family transcriptional regulator [Methanocorpusculum sp.]|nr:XRE family transcriptional regulator [Methanocorpusculum sp.]